jgi:predicted dienelactone hydrolase
MRPFEILLLAIGFLFAISGRRAVQWIGGSGYFFCILPLCAVLLQISMEGARWQMLPGYAAAVIVAAVAGGSGRWRSGFRFVAAVFIIAALAAGWIYPVYSLPNPTGPYPVGTIVLDVPRPLVKAADAGAQHGPLTIQLWYPVRSAEGAGTAPYALGAASTGIRAYLGTRRLVTTAALPNAGFLPGTSRQPVLLYASSWGGDRWENTAQAEELASHGYVVAAMGDPYPQLPLDLSSEQAYRRTVAWGDEKAKLEAEDAIGVLDVISRLDISDPAGRFTNRLDLSRVGFIGFSFGGAVAQEAAALDSRFKAIVNLDGWLFGDAADDWSKQPLLIISGAPATGVPPDEHNSPIPQRRYGALLDDRSERQMSAGFARRGGYLLKIAGTDHSNFSDEAFVSPISRLVDAGPLDRYRAARIVYDYLLQFFGKTLSGAPAPLLKPGAKHDRTAHLEIWQPPGASAGRGPR